MMQFLTKKINNKKGFTLIELIVVIAILAILALLAVPRFLGTLQTANERAFESNHRIVVSATQLHLAEEGVVAPDMTALVSGGFLGEDPSGDPENASYGVANGVVTSTYTDHRDATKTPLVFSP